MTRPRLKAPAVRQAQRFAKEWPWPRASCCGEPRVSRDVDRCYDHAKGCYTCGQPADDSRLCPTHKHEKLERDAAAEFHRSIDSLEALDHNLDDLRFEESA